MYAQMVLFDRPCQIHGANHLFDVSRCFSAKEFAFFINKKLAFSFE